ncbi:MAG: DUF2452 domain-containing protein [Bacteroidota bacterium]
MHKNPIDKDKVTDKPSTLEYAHTVGGAVIKPIDKGKVKGRALSAMEEQTHMQMAQIKEQIELLATQANALRDRVEISAKIYQADTGFEPLISHRYFLYENKKGGWVLSMVAPEEWGRKKPYKFLARVKLLADHTWEVEESAEDLQAE